METVNLHEAKTHLSRLVARAAAGEPFIIARAGKPLVKVVPIDVPEPSGLGRLGFMDGMMKIPEEFDELGREEIAAMFGVDE